MIVDLLGNPYEEKKYKRPVTAKDRAERISRRIEKKKERSRFKPFNAADFELSVFNEQKETGAQYIGQNLYIRPNYVVSMPEYCFFDRETGELARNPRTLTESFIENQKNLENNESSGKLSSKAVKSLKNSINWLCISAKKKRVFRKKDNSNFFFKVNFITLTLPNTKGHISSNDLQKKLLNPFLTYMRKYHGLANYVWRLEFQANGKLHVHLTCDSFLHLQVIRETWNRLLDNAGYLEEFHRVHGHKDPNSTDVHATKKVKNMAAYLAKYMSKKNSVYKISNKKNAKRLGVMQSKAWYFQRVNFWNSPFNPRPITGRLWSCNKELSQAGKLSVHIPASECAVDLKPFMRPDIVFKEIYSLPKKKNSSPYTGEAPEPERKKIGEVYFLAAMDWFTKISGPVRTAFEETRKKIANVLQVDSFEMGGNFTYCV